MKFVPHDKYTGNNQIPVSLEIRDNAINLKLGHKYFLSICLDDYAGPWRTIYEIYETGGHTTFQKFIDINDFFKN